MTLTVIGPLRLSPATTHWLTSQSNRLKIKYYARSGSFELNYRTSCDFTLDAAEGILTSPGYPNLDNRVQVCTYTIKAAPNTFITVKRIDFQLKSVEDDEYNVDCLTTNLKVSSTQTHKWNSAGLCQDLHKP